MNWKLLRSFLCRAAFVSLLGVLVCPSPATIAGAQNPPSAEAPAAQPAPKQDSTNPPTTNPAPANSPQNNPPETNPGQGETPFTFHENVQLVTTPVTVFDTSGNFVYDLEKDEFKIYDNGELQDIQQFDSEMRKLSLVIVVETNDATAPFLDSVHPLGSLFSDAVMGPQGEVAVITYSDHVELPLDFTSNGDKLDTVLRGLHGRGGGMHLDDAIAMALSKLDHRPKEDRKVVIIFSDGYNIGSQIEAQRNRAAVDEFQHHALWIGLQPGARFVGQAGQGPRSGSGGGKCGAPHGTEPGADPHQSGSQLGHV